MRPDATRRVCFPVRVLVAPPRPPLLRFQRLLTAAVEADAHQQMTFSLWKMS
jgi:hypothetical protein